jgi:hypothetical protein
LRPTTLYLLASPSTPEPVKQAVIERFEAGEQLPDRTIKQMVEDAKFEEQQAKQRAEEAAREAAISPRVRRSRAQREAEWARQKREREEIWARNKAAAEQAATLILEVIGERGDRLRELIKDLNYEGERAVVAALRGGLAPAVSDNKERLAFLTPGAQTRPDDDSLREAAADTNAALKLLGGLA